jgi:hypothetical protein
MGRCENERADFNQKADHLFLPSEFGDSRPVLAILNSHVLHGRFRPRQRQIPNPGLDNSHTHTKLISLSTISQRHDLRSSWSVPRSLRALITHPLEMAHTSRKVVRQPVRLPQSWPSLRRPPCVIHPIISPSHPRQTPRTTRFHPAGTGSTEYSFLSLSSR